MNEFVNYIDEYFFKMQNNELNTIVGENQGRIS
jgi:hypothetical protein